MLILLLIAFLLIGCATQAVPVATEVGGASGIETVESITPTFVVPTATEVVDTRTPWEKSRDFVEAASHYDGEVTFSHKVLTEKGEYYPLYWSPTHNSWKVPAEFSKSGVSEADLDRKGENLPTQAFPGVENPDGSLTMDMNGVEFNFPAKIFVPGFGEISMRELMEMDQDRFGDEIIEQALTALDADVNLQMYQSTEVHTQYGVFLPGFDVGDSAIYAYPIAGSGSKNTDIVESGKIIWETPGNQFAIPIFSPETGELMFFLNVQQGTLAKTLQFKYSPSGMVSMDITRDNDRFGVDDEFGILIENRDPELSHYEGGYNAMMTDEEPGIGIITDIERILKARTEQEILNIMNEFRIFISIPFRVMSPES